MWRSICRSPRNHGTGITGLGLGRRCWLPQTRALSNGSPGAIIQTNDNDNRKKSLKSTVVTNNHPLDPKEVERKAREMRLELGLGAASKTFDDTVVDMTIRKRQSWDEPMSSWSKNIEHFMGTSKSVLSHNDKLFLDKYMAELEVGDLVALDNDDSRMVGVVVHLADRTNTWHHTIIMSSGKVQRVSESKLIFKVPEFYRPEIFEGCLHECIIEDQEEIILPSSGRELICRPLQEFYLDSITLSNRILKVFPAVHRKLCDNDSLKNIYLFDFIKEVESELGLVNNQLTPKAAKRVLYATFLALKQSTNLWVLESDAKNRPNVISIMPSKFSQDYEVGTELLRYRSEAEYKEFLKKIELILVESQMFNSSLTKSDKDKPLIMKHINFTKSELAALGLIKYFAMGVISESDKTASSLIGIFIRSLNKFKTEVVDKNTVHKFLSSIGVFTPWENTSYLDTRLEIPERGINRFADEDQSFFNSYEFDPTLDRVKLLRKDWGDMRVYCIDDASAEEIDDGVSVKRLDNGKLRVYIHIADPASALIPGTDIAEIAFKRASTCYIPEGSISMFPSVIGEKLGLTKTSQKDKKRCMTFSIDFDPNYSDIKKAFNYNTAQIIPGYVNEIRPLTYDYVDKVLKSDKNSFEILSSDEYNEIKLLKKISMAFNTMRTDRGAVGFAFTSPKVTLDRVPEISAFNGTPIIYDPGYFPRVSIGHTINTPSRTLVSELMILANHISGRFSKNHGLKNVFRGQEFKINSTAAENLLKDILEKRNSEGNLDLVNTSKILPLTLAAYMTMKPVRHQTLGLDVYSQSTSPLRRFTDIIVHWQIQNYLLKKEGLLDESEVEQRVSHLNSRQGIIKRAQNNGMRFWLLKELQDKFRQNPSFKVPCIVMAPAVDNVQSVMLLDYSIFARVKLESPSQAAEIGSTVHLSNAAIDIENRRIEFDLQSV